MKKTALILLALLASAAVSCGSQAETAPRNTLTVRVEDLRAMTARVVELDRKTDTVTVENANGFRFAFYGCSDYCIGDYVSAVMHSNGTPEIADDYFLAVRYSGYCDYSGESLE